MRHVHARAALGIALAVTLGGAACTRTARPADAGPPLLTFNNESLDVVAVYALRPGGDAARLATVSPGRTETLRLPAGLATTGTITIVAVPLAGNRAASTGPISVGPGTRLAITMPTAQNILTVLPAP
jgi:hypothetical protein